MASPFPNFEVGDIVDLSLLGGGLVENAVITYVPTNGNQENGLYWEFVEPKTGRFGIGSNFIYMVKKN